MQTKIVYDNGFKKHIKCISVDISEEQFVKFLPKSRIVEIDGKDVVEEYVDVQIYDERVSYDEIFEANRLNLTDLIKVLQELKAQIK